MHDAYTLLMQAVAILTKDAITICLEQENEDQLFLPKEEIVRLFLLHKLLEDLSKDHTGTSEIADRLERELSEELIDEANRFLRDLRKEHATPARGK